MIDNIKVAIISFGKRPIFWTLIPIDPTRNEKNITKDPHTDNEMANISKNT